LRRQTAGICPVRPIKRTAARAGARELPPACVMDDACREPPDAGSARRTVARPEWGQGWLCG
jgi:hypothetical protein